METLFAFLILGGAAGVIYLVTKNKTVEIEPVPDATGHVEPQPQTGGGVQPGPVFALGIDPNDYRTWPKGDKVWDVCRAIAIAEGYEQPGSVPQRLCNPGDLSDGASTYGSEYHSGSNVTIFPDHQTGWNALYVKIKNAVTGRSQVYSPDMTWTQFAQKYAGSWRNWVNNVSRELSVSPSARVGDFFA